MLKIKKKMIIGKKKLSSGVKSKMNQKDFVEITRLNQIWLIHQGLYFSKLKTDMNSLWFSRYGCVIEKKK